MVSPSSVRASPGAGPGMSNAAYAGSSKGHERSGWPWACKMAGALSTQFCLVIARPSGKARQIMVTPKRVTGPIGLRTRGDEAVAIFVAEAKGLGRAPGEHPLEIVSK